MEPGGAQSAAYKIYKGLLDEVDVKLIFLYKKNEFLNLNKSIICLQNEKPSTFVGYLKILVDLFIYLKKEKPDVVLSLGQYVNVFGQLLALLLNTKKRIASQRNPMEYNSKFLNLLDKWYGQLGIYTNIIMVSETVNDSYEQYPSSYKNKTVVIPNGVLIDDLDDEYTDQTFVDDSKFNLLTVGRLAPEKNQITIINAVKDLENVVLYIIGDGPLKEEFYELTKTYDNIRLLGSMPRKKIPHYMKACDLFLLPSKYEGMSNALLEAIAYEMPVLVSAIYANISVFNDSSITNAVETEDVDAWKNYIIKLKKNEDKLNDLRQVSTKLKEKYSYQYMIENYRDILLG
jgi:glycosyltransferase involved in cell wall biosynthesis